MKPIGFIKVIDGVGRLGIPKDIRERLGLEGKVELIMTENGLLIRKYEEENENKSENSN
jgi:AbrB family looped-hinge helix DNA binding protein